MTEARVKTGFWVRALIRQVSLDGTTHAMVLKRGDEDAGALVIVLVDRTRAVAVLRETGADTIWERVAMESEAALDLYLERQKRYDPDLWILEIEMADVTRAIEQDLPGRRSRTENA